MNKRIAVAFVLTVSIAIGLEVWAQQGAKSGQWPNHSGDKGSTKYSPIDQINKSNVRNLRIVWRRPAAAEEFRKRKGDLVVPNNFRSTPLMINGVLYASNGIGLVEAFDPATGKTIWIQEPPESTPEALSGSSTRSIGYWRNTRGDDERLLSIRPPYLVAIHPKTGELIQSFGSAGKIDLRA